MADCGLVNLDHVKDSEAFVKRLSTQPRGGRQSRLTSLLQMAGQRVQIVLNDCLLRPVTRAGRSRGILTGPPPVVSKDARDSGIVSPDRLG